MEKDTRLWIKNFSVERASYQLLIPAYRMGWYNGQKTLFGEQSPFFIDEYFAILEGNNLEGSYFIKEELETLIEKTIEIILENPNHVKKIHEETYSINDSYFSFAKGLLDKNFSKISDKELKNDFEKITILQEKAHQHALCTTWFLDSLGETFSHLLIEKTQKIIKDNNSNLNTAETFSTLTTIPQNSLILEEEIESLQILQKINQDKNSKEVFQNLQQFSKVPENINLDIVEAIYKHFNKWRWIPFEYMGPAYQIDHFLKHWSSLLKTDIDISKEIKNILGRPQRIKKDQEKIYKELNPDLETKELFNIAANIVFLKGYRKDRCYFGFYVADFILREIAKRFFLSPQQIYLLTYEEIIDIFNKKKDIDLREINQRDRITVIFGDSKGVNILTGEDAQKFIESKNIEKEEEIPNSDRLQGTCACGGEAQGRVKIINSIEDIDKMETGDIMVSHNTFPSLVPAMKKAAAIITEDGGITCHAAIVSRELNTPCITGIKTATKALKDNDYIMVWADKGMVEIKKS